MLEKARVFSFDKESFAYVADLFEKFDRICDEYSKNDSYISFIYSKAKGHFLRIVLNFHILITSFNQIFDSFNLYDQDEETNSIFLNLKDSKRDDMINFYKNQRLTSYIELKTVILAEKILNYFVNHKLFLSGYFIENGKFVFTSVTNQSFSQNLPKFKIHRKILLSKERIIWCADMTRNKFVESQDQFIAICQELHAQHLGKIGYFKKNSSSGRQSLGFYRYKLPKEEDEIIRFVNALESFEISIDEFANFNTLSSESGIYYFFVSIY